MTGADLNGPNRIPPARRKRPLVIPSLPPSSPSHRLRHRPSISRSLVQFCNAMSKSKFEKAVEIVQSLPKEGPIQPTQTDQLYFYSYYKQATVGDVNIPKPANFFDFAGRAKWDAWNDRKGVSQEEAWSKYVEKLLAILEVAGTDEAKGHIDEINAA
ncbi:acyl CoA binding protein-domain-containing protein [Russula earlei]|uniref:Acyl CoA binding protein-domain-containing protein n=1 Tax=Russula earlei TaxID=71964 RepID=A0ACC0U4G7_9AGAM|nr:acyl CoA binding protein-domain-containing protein [Russula earlei]